MAFKLKNKELKRIIGELENASKMHCKQAEDLQSHVDDMQESPMKKYKSHAQRKAVHASKAENSPMTKKGPCWEGYEMIGMKDKGRRQVPNCVPKK